MDNRKVKGLTHEQLQALHMEQMAAKFDASAIKRKYLDCPYGTEARQKLDIYLPDEGEGPFPVVVFLHGGAWCQGDKSDAQALPFIPGVERGYAVVLAAYRLVPQINYPENLYDVKALLRWIAENGAQYGLDPERCALTGASAGAHLAMMAAFTAGQAAFEGAPLSRTCRIKAVVNQFGPTDFYTSRQMYEDSGLICMYDPNSRQPLPEEHMLGFSLSELKHYAPFFTPLANVHPGIPPVLSQHGVPDPCVPYQQSVTLTEKIRAVCGADRAELDLQETFSHADLRFASPEEVDRIFTFLDKHVK